MNRPQAPPAEFPRRGFLGRTLAGSVGLCLAGGPSQGRAGEATISAPDLPDLTGQDALRICFFTDAHLPAPLSKARPNHQERIRRAFDRANAFQPAAYIFGGDNVFGVDQSNQQNAEAQFEGWKAVVREKVSVPHYSVIGNHDICPGDAPKAMALEAFGMPHRYYAWKMGGWKFIMLDVFGSDGKLDANSEQSSWLGEELQKPEDKEPVCIVSHAPLAGLTTEHVGGRVEGVGFHYRPFFYRHPQVRLALSGHQHMVDCCRLDRVTYICGGAVCGGWWQGDHSHFGPAFLIFDLKPAGTFNHQEIFWEHDHPGPHNEKELPVEQHKDLYNS